MTETKKLRIIRGKDWTPKFMAYMAPVLMMSMLVNQFLNLKSIDVFGLSLIASMITYPLSLIVCDIMTEVYGYKRVRKLIYICLGLYALSMGFVQVAVHLPPAVDYPHNEIYTTLFSQLPQIAIAGIVGYFFGELINSYLLSRFKSRTNGKYFYFRALASTFISQGINCFVFYGIGFWGIMSLKTIVESTAIAIGIIMAYELIVLPLTKKCAWRLKQMEGVEYFDD